MLSLSTFAQSVCAVTGRDKLIGGHPQVLRKVRQPALDRDIAGLASVFGITTGTLVHVLAAALGLSALLRLKTVPFPEPYPAAVERSRSGNGAHVWFFFSSSVPAVAARKMGCYLITETMSR
jgi:hypothetical protein